jgi:hypothetical protein
MPPRNDHSVRLGRLQLSREATADFAIATHYQDVVAAHDLPSGVQQLSCHSSIEARAVDEEGTSKTIGELLRDVGRWEGETGAALDALFTRQPGNRRVPDLP